MSFFGYSKLTQDQAKLFIIDCYMGVLKRYPEKNVLEKDSLEISSGIKSCAEFLSGVVYSKEFKALDGHSRLHDLSTSYSDFEYINAGLRSKIKRIIYLGFSVNRPIGGMKVIIHHSELIKSMSSSDLSSAVFFPENTGFNITWLDTEFETKRDHKFNISEDFIVIPELWALHYGSLFRDAGLRYAVFVQNGYLLFDEISGVDKIKLNELRSVYLDAELVLSISQDVTDCINTVYPGVKDKIVQVTTSVDKKLFSPAKFKKNKITYMPRKLSAHSSWVVSLLVRNLPENWEVIQINHMTEAQVASVLAESKIFMSFSDQEGLGLPPLEAALCGNKIIGYTGQAGKEYWRGSIFQEIEPGNLLTFVDAVMEEVKKLNNTDPVTLYPNFLSEMSQLTGKYSKDAEIASLKNFIELILEK